MTLKDALELLLALALLLATACDLVWRRIPDWLNLPVLGLALVMRVWSEGVGNPESGLVSGLIASGAAAALFALLAWRGQGKSFGWGDVKLMAAVGAALGYPLVFSALVFISLVGALQAALTVVWHGAVWETVQALAARWARLVKVELGTPGGQRHIPYAVAIALGSAWAMWWDRRGSP